jgi:hypothetical protein
MCDQARLGIRVIGINSLDKIYDPSLFLNRQRGFFIIFLYIFFRYTVYFKEDREMAEKRRGIYFNQGGVYGSPLPSGLERLRLPNNPQVIIPETVKRNGNGITDVKPGGNNDILPSPIPAPSILWTPADATTTAWYDASDADTITITESGDVSQWDDKSGNLNHVSEGTVGYQPTYSSTGWDGSLPTVDFTITGSVGNQLESLTSNGFTDTEHVIFVMTEPLSRVNQTRYTVLKLFSSDDAKDLFNKSGNGDIQGMGTRDATATYVGEATLRPIRKQMLTCDYSSGGEFYRDGDSVFSGAWTPKTILIDGGFKISSATSARYDGKMSEIIIMNKSDCDNATRQKAEGYLAWKWGLVGNLPSGHPYKENAPYV